MKSYTFYIDKIDLEQVKVLAMQTNLTASEIIRGAIRDHLEKVEKDGVYIRETKR